MRSGVTGISSIHIPIALWMAVCIEFSPDYNGWIGLHTLIFIRTLQSEKLQKNRVDLGWSLLRHVRSMCY